MNDNNYKKSYYAIIPAEVRYDKRLKPLCRLLYAEITALTNDKGYCWASNAYFASLYSISSTTVSRYVSELKEYGYIKIHYDKKDNNTQKRKIYLNSLKNYKVSDNKVLSEKSNGYCQNTQESIDQTDKDNNKFNNKINNDMPPSEFDLFVKSLIEVFNRTTCSKAEKLSQIHCFKTKDKQRELIDIFNNRRYSWKDSIKYAELKIKDKNNITTLWLDFVSYLKIYLTKGDREQLIKRHYSEKELYERNQKLKEMELLKIQKEKEEREKLLEEEKRLGIDNMTEDEIIEFTKNRFKHLQRK